MGADQSPERIAAAVLGRAADTIEHEHYINFTGGPNLWSAIHRAVGDLVTGPVVEHLRCRLRVRQVQFWDGGQDEAVAVLRAAAAASRRVLAGYQKASAMKEIDDARAVLRAALGPGRHDESLSTLADSMQHRLHLAGLRIAELEAQNARLREAVISR